MISTSSISPPATASSSQLQEQQLTSSFQDGVNYVSESIQGAGAKASHEANKETAKSSDASLSTRATAAKDSVGDKFDQKSHDSKAEVHKG